MGWEQKGDGNRNGKNGDWNGNGEGDGNRNGDGDGDGKREQEFPQKLHGQRRLKLWVIFFTNKTRDN